MARRSGKFSRLDTRPRRLRLEPLEDRRMLAMVTVDTELDVVDGGDGLTSLREAITATNAMAGADTIEFDASLAGKTILLTQGELELTEAATINGLGEDLLTIDAQQQSRILKISTFSGDFTITGLTLTGGKAAGPSGYDAYGGAIFSYSNGTLTIDRTIITGNSSGFGGVGSRGGGIFANGPVSLLKSTVSNNTASMNQYAYGGGISTSGSLTITDSTISGNQADGQVFSWGGGVKAGQVTLINSIVSGNRTRSSRAIGGGISAVILTAVNSVISGNTADGFRGDYYPCCQADFGGDGRGGGISASEVTLTGSTVSNNETIGRNAKGGGVYARDQLVVTDSTISGNITRGFTAPGGGLYARGYATLAQSTISENTSYSGDGHAKGGGIYLIGQLTLSQSTVSGNTASGEGTGGFNGQASGGGIYTRGSSTTLVVTQSTVSGNSSIGYESPVRGGGLHTQGPLTVTQSTISSNSATNASSFHSTTGGGLMALGDTVINNTILAGNTAGSSAPDLRHDGVAIIDASFSLIGDNDGSPLAEAQTPDINGNLIGSAAGSGIIDPLLGPLQHNGGPTLTHALLPGSPAIDAGQTFALVTLTGVVSSTGATDLFPVGNLINNSGFSATPTESNYEMLLHAVADATTGWVTDQPGPIPSYYYDFEPPPVLTFDLGSLQELNAMVVWGFLLNQGESNNEARSFTLEFSTDGGVIFGNALMLEHARTGGAQETLQFGQTVLADTVRVTITDNHLGTAGANGGGRVGLGEVKFLALSDVGPFDQRGEIYTRVFGGRIDMGAVESQPQHADFDGDGFVTGFDFLAWQIGFGTPAPNATKADGDADDDMDVDGDDLTAWENAYGAQPNPPPLAAVVHLSLALPIEGREQAVAVVEDDTVRQSERAVRSSATAPALHAELVDMAQAVALSEETDGASGEREFVERSLPQEFSSAEAVGRSDSALGSSSSSSLATSTLRDPERQSPKRPCPWEDAVDELFASAFE